jgi:CBS domain-containing protein
MTENPITARPNDSLTSVIKLMKENKIRHIPIVDESGKPLGMISLRDVLDFIILILSFVRGGGNEG